MRPVVLVSVLVVSACALGAAARSRFALDGPPTHPSVPAEPRRIISLAPSVTETLFALGLGDRVVGVTDFCRFPAEARSKPRVGGFHNLNYEAIVSLRPDLAVTLVEQQPARNALAILGIPSISVSHQSIDGVLDSIPAIGQTCGVAQRAEVLAADLRARLEAVERMTCGLPRPTVLIVVSREWGAGSPRDLIVAAADGHLDRIVDLAGGRNVVEGAVARFPAVSSEAILSLDPDVILELPGESVAASLGVARLAADWAGLDRLEAVRRRRVVALADDHATIPGPAVVEAVERVARLLHPEADWP